MLTLFENLFSVFFAKRKNGTVMSLSGRGYADNLPDLMAMSLAEMGGGFCLVFVSTVLESRSINIQPTPEHDFPVGWREDEPVHGQTQDALRENKYLYESKCACMPQRLLSRPLQHTY